MAFVVLTPPNQNALIASDDREALRKTDQYLWCGQYYCNLRFRTLISFDLSLFSGQVNLLSAYLKMYVNKTTFEDTITARITPYLITQAWNEQTVSWQNQPSFDTNITGSTPPIKGTGWVLWNISNIVMHWYQGGLQNNGILLKSPELQNFEAKRFFGQEEDIYVWLRPKLVIFFDQAYPSHSNITMAGRFTQTLTETVTTSDSFLWTMPVNTAQIGAYTFFIKNVGANAALVLLETGPTHSDFIINSGESNIAAGEIISLVPYVYGNFARLGFRSKDTAQSTTLKIWYQSQT